MDIFCAIVPYFLIRKLNIPREDKRALIILMGGSIFGTIAAVMKIVAMSTISNVADVTSSSSGGKYGNSGRKITGSNHMPLVTIGGTERKRDIPCPYNMGIRDDSSDENLNNRKDKSGGDSESVENILPKSGEDDEGGQNARIRVTTEVHLSFNR
ncbi:hypothetical protein CC80DRAFT_549657 [Byssothecium circinans]|uniref:Uncharacterized protein n=1 Tax=Byssothecium circinans TaxID=147558 RepID=A0A6A5TRB0_9PLEO|nr:hypothetical protein CC80DRAFT_549657 [Byssothecium circinans]